LKQFIFNNEILPTNYIKHRNRCNGRGGGILLAVKKSISSVSSPSHLDLLSVSITYSKTFIFNLGLLHIPLSVSSSCLSDIESFLHTLKITDNLILLGDFNFLDVDWNTMIGHTPQSLHFCDLIFELNLVQLITEPTHKGSNLLDVILTNIDYIDNISISTLSTILPNGLSSDHYLINFSVKLLLNSCQLVPDYSHADGWNDFLAFLASHDFTLYFDITDVEALWLHLGSYYQWKPPLKIPGYAPVKLASYFL